MSLPIERLAAWLVNIATGEQDAERAASQCSVCSAAIVGPPTLTAAGVTLCDDPDCHIDELERRW